MIQSNEIISYTCLTGKIIDPLPTLSFLTYEKTYFSALGSECASERVKMLVPRETNVVWDVRRCDNTSWNMWCKHHHQYHTSCFLSSVGLNWKRKNFYKNRQRTHFFGSSKDHNPCGARWNYYDLSGARRTHISYILLGHGND